MTRFGGRTTSNSSYTDWSGAVSRKKFLTPTSISHLAVLKSMNGSDWCTCTSNLASRPWRSDSAGLAGCENALLTRYSTSTRVEVSGTSVSIDVDTSWIRSSSVRTDDGDTIQRYERASLPSMCACAVEY